MSLVPRNPSPMSPLVSLLQETVTVPLLDLYELLMRAQSAESAERKDPQMTAPKTQATKRGYRRLSMVLKVAEYEMIAAMAEQEDRTADQQALHMVRRLLSELQVEAIKDGYRQAVSRRQEALLSEEGDREGQEDGESVDPHGIELGEVNRTE